VGQLRTGEVDLIVRGLAERVRIIRTRVPAPVETVARSLTAPPAAGTWHPLTPGRAVASREVPGPSSRVNPSFGSFGPGLTRLAVPSGNTGRRERARSTRQSTAKGQARSGRDGAGLVRDADGSRRWATALLTGTSSDRTPEHRSFRCVPSPCRFRRAPPVSPPEPLGRTAVNLAAGTGCRMCHRSQAGGDLRHTPGFR